MKPRRIQRRRTKGWRMPENTVYVGRPGKWGNPYWDVQRYGLDLCLKMFADTARGFWDPSNVPEGPMRDQWLKWLYEAHDGWVKRICRHPVEVAVVELRGKNLACWCPLTTRCHADTLLEIANE